MSNLIERLERLMTEFGWEHADVVKISGQSSSVVSQWLGRGSKEIKTIGKQEAAEALAQATGYSALWIAKGIGPERLALAQLPNAQSDAAVAHTMSPQGVTVDAVSPLAWEAILLISKKSELPPSFCVALPDDSMAPRARAGAVAYFSRDAEPKPGDGVLVRDKSGAVHFRQFRQRRPGHWEAYAINQDYQPLQSADDGLEVLGVLTALEARWAQ